MVLLSTITFIISTADELQVGVGHAGKLPIWSQNTLKISVADLKPKLYISER